MYPFCSSVISASTYSKRIVFDAYGPSVLSAVGPCVLWTSSKLSPPSLLTYHLTQVTKDFCRSVGLPPARGESTTLSPALATKTPFSFRVKGVPGAKVLVPYFKERVCSSSRIQSAVG